MATMHLDVGAGVTACRLGATGRAVREHDRCSAIELVTCGACRRADARELEALGKADAHAAHAKSGKACPDPYRFKADARALLIELWRAQVEIYPRTREIPPGLYVKVNLRACMRNLARKAHAHAAA